MSSEDTAKQHKSPALEMDTVVVADDIGDMALLEKPWYESLTMWGGIISAASSALITISPWFAVGAAVGGALAVIGRLRAKRQIYIRRTSTTKPQT